MSQCIALQDGFIAITEYLESLGRSSNSKNRYTRAFTDISGYYDRRHVMEYQSDINKEYREDVNNRYYNGLISKKKQNRFTRLSFMLDSYYAGKPFELKYSRGLRYKVHLDGFFQTNVDEFETYLKGQMSWISVPGYISIARDFFYYLQKSEIRDFRNLRDDDIVQFITGLHESRPSSMNNVCCAARKLMEFLGTKGCTVSSKTVSYKAAPTRREIHSALEEEELQIILDTPDRNTIMGKRDYAVLLLASFTGLRAIDIANLRFDNYNPGQRTIYLVQHKTGTPVGLPIPDEAVAAINDYVEHGRPNIECPYIFLTADRPFRKLSDKSSVRNILLKQLKDSSLGYNPGTGRGFHVFRRTMGKWLLGASVNPEMISQVLGHRDGEVLKRYLPLTPNSMRECALGFETAPLRTEVFG